MEARKQGAASSARQEVIDVGCGELADGRCPCRLADTAECSYCPLLRAEAVCGCDWQGRCAYELYQWRDEQTPAASPPPAGK